jgi:hypothetical protein
MRLRIVTICLLLATACSESVALGPAVPLNVRFTLEQGHAVPVERTELRIQFVGVFGDSRCPADAICIQGGDAVVRIRVADTGTLRTYDLHTGDANRASVSHGALLIELVELLPYPFSSRTIDQDDYVATLLVRR